ncbi:general secretion pathway protein I [Desulfosarcina sp. BuS5]|uniref:type II secretion system protein n=1 Tax=Desulfosarcina sp. BuS5 TaxID=933262 RepID=UPI00048948A3|nr:type II secretion system protein [Desulfosarcina sp. BuS5]WDN90303.1 general secretion pathway protein I [Desulfosarcina sp. BuS5]
MHRILRKCRAAAGFTLIEILVALVILSISLVTIMQLFSGGLKASRIAGDYTQAIFLAREKMEELLLDKEDSTEITEGDFNNDYKWQAEITPFSLTAGDDNKVPVEVYEIQVSVSRKDDTGKQVLLQTLKTVKKEDES